MNRIRQEFCKIKWKKVVVIVGFCLTVLCLGAGYLHIRNFFTLCMIFMTILLWTADAVPKWMSSLFLLVVLTIVRAASLDQIFKFPLSQNFWLIVLSYLFAEGIKNSRLFEMALPYMKKYVRGVKSLAVSILIGCAAAIWIIPQPYTRLIILLQLYSVYFESLHLSGPCKKVLCLWIVNSSMFLNAAFFRGDIILNSVLLEIGGLEMSELEWGKWMFPPTVAYTVLGAVLFYFVFHRELSEFHAPLSENAGHDGKGKGAIALIVSVTVLLWLFEPVLHIPALAVLTAAIAAMMICGIVSISDFKSINVGLLLFLTAAFSIGPAVSQSGVTKDILEALIPSVPDKISYPYLLCLLFMGMILHMMLGSCVTVLSIAIPSIMILTGGADTVCPILFTVFIGCTAHYIFCIHNVLLMVGMGVGHYSDTETRRYGKWLTLCTLAAAVPVYMIYWKAVHLI